MQPTLKTERLVLRPFRIDDVAPLFPILSDTEAMRLFGPHARISETEAFVRSTVDAPPEVSCDFIVERDGRVIGKAGMWRTPEIGFFIAREQWRRGYAREALDAIIPHLFTNYPVPALTADVDPENAASLALLEGLGFRETGRARETIRILGEWRDSIYLALDRPV